MLAFSTSDNHDASTLQQLSLKSRNKLIRLTPMDRASMEHYLINCHERGKFPRNAAFPDGFRLVWIGRRNSRVVG